MADALEEFVHDALKNADEAGYFVEGYFNGFTPRDIAVDIIAYSDSPTDDADALTPHVSSWLSKHKK